LEPNAIMPKDELRERTVYEHRFGESAPYTIGVEEELLLVDDGFCLAPDSEKVTDIADPKCGEVVSEIFAAQVELTSEVCSNVSEAVDCLRHLRSAVIDGGATPMGAGLHPDGALGDAAIVEKARYQGVRDALAGLLRTPPCALHVHVGMPDPETAVRTANGLRRHVPLLQALSANSPFWHGRDSGLASARAAILRSYPRVEIPRPFLSYEDFCQTVEELAVAAEVDDYTYFWWDVRIHPRLGTVEVRSLDTQSSLERAGALAALVHALARYEAECAEPIEPSREALSASAFQAGRYGLDAKLVGSNGTLMPAREVAMETLAKVAEFATELDAGLFIDAIAEIVAAGNGADLQRAIYARRGMDGLLRYLVEETRADL
jgi:glutamate---cysteine ligase / carboxylate-amine ligase